LIDRRLGHLTSDEVHAILARGEPTAVLVPVGSVEPHGPHLPLATDTVISETASLRACDALAARGVDAYLAPSVGYGVTEFAEGFAGVVGVPAPVLTELLRSIARSLLTEGWAHVCFVNNHLEPAHDQAVRAAAKGLSASVACPLDRRWARTLSDEFKRGACHAGRYETSLVLAAGPFVRDEHRALPAIATSLSLEIAAGKNRFLQMGLDRAYTGAPSEATRAEGDELYIRLVAMIVGEVTEGLKNAPPLLTTPPAARP
jgi:creatinine amidohydrolase